MYNFNPYQPIKQCVVPEVNGINGANAYQIAPNSSVLLLDNKDPIVYLKQTDGGGYATTTAFDLVPHKDKTQIEYDDINTRLSRLEQIINEQTSTTRTNEQPDEQSADSTSNATVQNARNDSSTVGRTDGTATGIRY